MEKQINVSTTTTIIIAIVIIMIIVNIIKLGVISTLSRLFTNAIFQLSTHLWMRS